MTTHDDSRSDYEVTDPMQAKSGDAATVLQDIRDLLGPYNKNAIDVTEATDINADLDIDSVAILDLLMTIEDSYNISIPINLLADVRTVGDLAATVRAAIEARTGDGAS